jgi:hypothetical protein
MRDPHQEILPVEGLEVMAFQLEGEARHKPRAGAIAAGLFLQGLACLQVDFGQPLALLLFPVLPGVVVDLEFLLLCEGFLKL